MFKSTIVAIMILMMSLSAGARPFVMSYSDFVHLSDRQKDEYIIKLMELTIELESRYKHETAAQGFSQERFERYSKILNTLKSVLFVPSAYAADAAAKPSKKFASMEWETFASEFDRLMNTRQSTVRGTLDDTCIFAGWVSRVRPDPKDGQPTCGHPDFVDGHGPNRHVNGMSQESIGYPYPNENTSCTKDDHKMIQCNPLIFGYKAEDKKSLFCVQATDKARNASYDCMLAALDERETPGVDSKDKRLKFLRKKLAANPTIFNQVWEFTYKTCVCPTVTSNRPNGAVTFGQEYQNLIRPHRTCYGLMEMMGSTALECESTDAFPIRDTKIFSDLKNIINRKTVTDQKTVDTEYGKYLTSMEAKKSAEYVRICGGEVYKEPEVPVTTPDDPGNTPAGKTYSCTGECETKSTVAVGPDDSVELAEANPVSSLVCTPKIMVKEGDAAAVEVKTEDIEGEITKSETPTKEKSTVDVKFKLKGGEEKTISCAFNIKDPVTTPVTTPSTEKPSLDTTIDGCPGNTCTITAVYDKAKATGWTLSWDFKTPPQGETIPKGWDVKPETTTTPGIAEGGNPTTAATTTAPDSVKQPKAKAKYEVCAKLSKGSEATDLSCKEVPALKKEKEDKPASSPSTGMNGGRPMPPQVQMRGASDTSAVGIK